MNEFPPKTNHPREVEVLLEFLASVINEEKTVYVSTPITSGKYKMQFYENDSYLKKKKSYTDDEIFEKVIEFNCARAKTAIKKIKSKIDVLIIDPTAVKVIKKWTQSDYRFVWARVIEIYADKVVNVDGWNYSDGCAYEFLTAKRLDKKVLDEDLKPITLKKGLQLVQEAIGELTNTGLPVKFLKSIVAELNRIK